MKKQIDKTTNEFKVLKRKYFWEQKRKEILTFFGLIFLFIFPPYLFGKFMYFINPTSFLFEIEGVTIPPSNGDLWGIGIIIILFGITIGLILLGIVSWIQSNLKKAEQRAEWDMKAQLNYKNKKEPNKK